MSVKLPSAGYRELFFSLPAVTGCLQYEPLAYRNWIHEQQGRLDEHHQRATLIYFANDSDATMFVLKWGVK